MSFTKTIVVIGATGFQGGSVVETFIDSPGWHVRALTRNHSSLKAQALAARGVEIVEAELSDVKSLEKAFEGAHAIFSVTDFWAIAAAAATDTPGRAKVKPGQGIAEYCFEVELQQGKNVFDAAAKTPSLERLVFSTLPHIDKLSSGKYDKAYHFDSKGLAVEYGRKRYPELWEKTSLLQLGFYLSNFTQMEWAKPRKNENDGVYEFAFAIFRSSVPMVAAEADTGPLTKLLVDQPAGKKLAAYREDITMEAFADTWSRILGVEARVTDGKIAFPADFQEDIDHTFAFCSEFNYYGRSVDKTVVSARELDPDLKLGTVEEWIKVQDWSQIVNA